MYVYVPCTESALVIMQRVRLYFYLYVYVVGNGKATQLAREKPSGTTPAVHHTVVIPPDSPSLACQPTRSVCMYYTCQVHWMASRLSYSDERFSRYDAVFTASLWTELPKHAYTDRSKGLDKSCKGSSIPDDGSQAHNQMSSLEEQFIG